jgi:RNA polymerase sigma-70 factor (ECF subfamily)
VSGKNERAGASVKDAHDIHCGNSAPGDPVTVSPSLLGRLRAREPDAWRRLTALYGPVVYSWCRRAGLGPDDAADVGQEVFLAVSSGLAGFRRDRSGDTFGGWLRGITRNKLRDHWRHRGGQPAAAGGTTAQQRFQQVAEPGDADTGDADPEAGSQFRHAFERIRGEFSERTWQAFWRVVVEGRDAAEVARQLGMSRGAVYIAKSRVLRRFRDEFGDLLE